MRILGVDGALEMSGICFMNGDLVEELTVIRTTKRKATPTESLRLRQIYTEFSEYLDKHRPEAVVIENLHVNRRNPKTSVLLGRVRGVYQVACALAGVPLYTLEPAEVKRGVHCKGNAGKNIIQEAVVELYGDQPIVQEKLGTYIEKGMRKTDDMADALALVHTFKTMPNIAIPS